MPPKFGGAAKCSVCMKSAYLNESITFNNVLYHDACFQCKLCGSRIGGFHLATEKAGLLYHKNCAKKLPLSSAVPELAIPLSEPALSSVPSPPSLVPPLSPHSDNIIISSSSSTATTTTATTTAATATTPTTTTSTLSTPGPIRSRVAHLSASAPRRPPPPPPRDDGTVLATPAVQAAPVEEEESEEEEEEEEDSLPVKKTIEWTCEGPQGDEKEVPQCDDPTESDNNPSTQDTLDSILNPPPIEEPFDNTSLTQDPVSQPDEESNNNNSQEISSNSEKTAAAAISSDALQDTDNSFSQAIADVIHVENSIPVGEEETVATVQTTEIEQVEKVDDEGKEVIPQGEEKSGGGDEIMDFFSNVKQPEITGAQEIIDNVTTQEPLESNNHNDNNSFLLTEPNLETVVEVEPIDTALIDIADAVKTETQDENVFTPDESSSSLPINEGETVEPVSDSSSAVANDANFEVKETAETVNLQDENVALQQSLDESNSSSIPLQKENVDAAEPIADFFEGKPTTDTQEIAETSVSVPNETFFEGKSATTDTQEIAEESATNETFFEGKPAITDTQENMLEASAATETNNNDSLIPMNEAIVEQIDPTDFGDFEVITETFETQENEATQQARDTQNTFNFFTDDVEAVAEPTNDSISSVNAIEVKTETTEAQENMNITPDDNNSLPANESENLEAVLAPTTLEVESDNVVTQQPSLDGNNNTSPNETGNVEAQPEFTSADPNFEVKTETTETDASSNNLIIPTNESENVEAAVESDSTIATAAIAIESENVEATVESDSTITTAAVEATVEPDSTVAIVAPVFAPDDNSQAGNADAEPLQTEARDNASEKSEEQVTPANDDISIAAEATTTADEVATSNEESGSHFEAVVNASSETSNQNPAISNEAMFYSTSHFSPSEMKELADNSPIETVPVADELNTHSDTADISNVGEDNKNDNSDAAKNNDNDNKDDNSIDKNDGSSDTPAVIDVQEMSREPVISPNNEPGVSTTVSEAPSDDVAVVAAAEEETKLDVEITEKISEPVQVPLPQPDVVDTEWEEPEIYRDRDESLPPDPEELSTILAIAQSPPRSVPPSQSPSPPQTTTEEQIKKEQRELIRQLESELQTLSQQKNAEMHKRSASSNSLPGGDNEDSETLRVLQATADEELGTAVEALKSARKTLEAGRDSPFRDVPTTTSPPIASQLQEQQQQLESQLTPFTPQKVEPIPVDDNLAPPQQPQQAAEQPARLSASSQQIERASAEDVHQRALYTQSLPNTPSGHRRELAPGCGASSSSESSSSNDALSPWQILQLGRERSQSAGTEARTPIPWGRAQSFPGNLVEAENFAPPKVEVFNILTLTHRRERSEIVYEGSHGEDGSTRSSQGGGVMFSVEDLDSPEKNIDSSSNGHVGSNLAMVDSDNNNNNNSKNIVHTQSEEMLPKQSITPGEVGEDSSNSSNANSQIVAENMPQQRDVNNDTNESTVIHDGTTGADNVVIHAIPFAIPIHYSSIHRPAPPIENGGATNAVVIHAEQPPVSEEEKKTQEDVQNEVKMDNAQDANGVSNEEQDSFPTENIGELKPGETRKLGFLRKPTVSQKKLLDYEQKINSRSNRNLTLDIDGFVTKPRKVTVMKNPGVPLGMTVVSAASHTLLPGVLVAELNTGGPAASTGLINRGDHLLMINGFSTVGMTVSKVMELIRGVASVREVILELLSPEGDIPRFLSPPKSPPPAPKNPRPDFFQNADPRITAMYMSPENCIKFVLKKALDQPMGIAISPTLPDAVLPGVFVSHVDPKGIAGADNRDHPLKLMHGDQLMMVNGQSMTGKTFTEAKAVLRECSKSREVRFEVVRTHKATRHVLNGGPHGLTVEKGVVVSVARGMEGDKALFEPGQRILTISGLSMYPATETLERYLRSDPPLVIWTIRPLSLFNHSLPFSPLASSHAFPSPSDVPTPPSPLAPVGFLPSPIPWAIPVPGPTSPLPLARPVRLQFTEMSP